MVLEKSTIFHGEFINGERNGNGKEFYDGRLKFEGKYSKDKRNGNGKEFKNGEIIFEGIYINGQRWKGKGKEYYDSKGILIYENEYDNGKKLEKNPYFK